MNTSQYVGMRVRLQCEFCTRIFQTQFNADGKTKNSACARCKANKLAQEKNKTLKSKFVPDWEK